MTISSGAITDAYSILYLLELNDRATHRALAWGFSDTHSDLCVELLKHRKLYRVGVVRRMSKWLIIVAERLAAGGLGGTWSISTAVSSQEALQTLLGLRISKNFPSIGSSAILELVAIRLLAKLTSQH